MAERNFRVWRGDAEGGEFVNYKVEMEPGMVVLDAIHRIQTHQANDLAVRWNCKAGKCGSCSCEVNGKPKLSCMTRVNDYAPEETITVQPLKTFPIVKDLVTDVTWNYEQKAKIQPLQPRPREADGTHRMQQEDVDRKDAFVGPRFMIHLAQLEMHPLDTADRIPAIKNEYGSGLCNITRCCTDVCPEHIGITDNAIIPLKERVVDRYYDPVMMIWRAITGAK